MDWHKAFEHAGLFSVVGGLAGSKTSALSGLIGGIVGSGVGDLKFDVVNSLDLEKWRGGFELLACSAFMGNKTPLTIGLKGLLFYVGYKQNFSALSTFFNDQFPPTTV